MSRNSGKGLRNLHWREWCKLNVAQGSVNQNDIVQINIPLQLYLTHKRSTFPPFRHCSSNQLTEIFMTGLFVVNVLKRIPIKTGFREFSKIFKSIPFPLLVYFL